jgi:hypothetical protein
VNMLRARNNSILDWDVVCKIAWKWWILVPEADGDIPVRHRRLVQCFDSSMKETFQVIWWS